MLTVRSISAGGAGDYADYLDAMTVAPEQGDYYLGRDGQPVAAPGVWHARAETLRAVGIEPGDGLVSREALVALMQGVRPDSGEALRGKGQGGKRNAGADMVFSAPKSVSVAWALGGAGVQGAVEAAHAAAVKAAVEYVRQTVPLIAPNREPALAADLLAGEFRHTTSRAIAGRAADPQLHSHVVLTSAVDDAGQVRAIRDRTVYRAAREAGAFYRAALAEQLADQGFELRTQTGKDGRYFELEGISDEVCRELSGRAREIERLTAEFQAKTGRLPVESELQAIKMSSREAKVPQTERELRAAWAASAKQHGLTPGKVERLHGRGRPVEGRDVGWGERVEQALTAERSTFGARELRATALEQAAGTMSAGDALRRVDGLLDSGQLIALEGGRLTTRTIRAKELDTITLARDLASADGPGLSAATVGRAEQLVCERLGGPLSVEQHEAVRTLTGPERLVVLEGQAGTGKGVVLDTIARAEQGAGRQVIGAAIAGRTAQRLGEDSPALEGSTMTVAALLTRSERGQLQLDRDTTIVVDEAGMVDTHTMHALVRTAAHSGARLVLAGDRAQLDAIGAGGMFAQLAQTAPLAKVQEVRRTPDPEEREAWTHLRQGRGARAMEHYAQRGQIHLAEERQHALAAAADRYHELVAQHGHEQVALMSDGSRQEIDRLNARVQHLRTQQGELTAGAVPLPRDPQDPDSPTYSLHGGDLVVWREIQRTDDDLGRVENGTRGTVTAVNPDRGELLVQLAGSDRQIHVAGENVGRLRLGYAGSVYRQQGATVDRAVAVTGGWQADRAGAYVQASRARHGIDWHVNKQDLGDDQAQHLQELSRKVSIDRSKTASIAHPTAVERPVLVGAGVDLRDELAPPEPEIPGVEPQPAPVGVGLGLGDGLDGPLGPLDHDVEFGVEVEL